MAAPRARMRLGLTEAGRMLLLGTIFFGLAAQLVPAFGVLSALIVVLLTVLVVGFVLRPRIEMTARFPDHVVSGQSAPLRFTLKNVARVPAYDLLLRFVDLPATIEQVAGPEMIARLGPGESTQVSVTIRARRRGNHSIRLPRCESSFPFNLMNFGSVRKDRQTLTVLPLFYRLQMRLMQVNAQSRCGVAGFAGRAEVSPEYAGNRPFLPGDSPRRIDTRAWARLSVPATKEYHNDADRYAALVLDTRITTARRKSNADEIPELEAAISLCASVAFTIKAECLIDWLLAGPELHDFAAWPRRTRVDKIHETLAAVDPADPYDLNPTMDALASRFGRISEVVFILLKWDRTYSNLLELATAARCRCTVCLVTADGEDLRDIETLRGDSVVVLSPDDILAGRTRPL